MIIARSVEPWPKKVSMQYSGALPNNQPTNRPIGQANPRDFSQPPVQCSPYLLFTVLLFVVCKLKILYIKVEQQQKLNIISCSNNNFLN